MTHRIIIDSGAFSVWAQGASIDLKEYVRFCKRYPDVDYYVNLDKIPGIPNQKRTVTPESVEDSCKVSWENYQYMLRHLPIEKVIPVFHQNESLRWLEKYLRFGTPYLGISPANDNTTLVKAGWMSEVRKHVLDTRGDLIVKTHGFAVTSYDLMKYMPWYSVDSASWKMTAAWGGIYVPRKTGGVYDYGKPPFIVAVSPKSSKTKRGMHFDHMSPGLRTLVLDFLKEVGVEFGEYVIVPVPADYKRNPEKGREIWYKKGKSILRTVVHGVVTSHERRCLVNLKFIHRANKVLPIRFIYAAGAIMPYDIEYYPHSRLLSYHVIDERALHRHLDLVRGRKERMRHARR
jgi:hypothetical protein